MISDPAIGARFGRYVVTATGVRAGKVRGVGVRCDCGNERVVQLVALTSGRTSSCGCGRGKRKPSPPTPDAGLIGQRFGRLTIAAVVGRTLTSGRLCAVRCDCGNERQVPIANLRSGNTKSCGCLQREVASVTVAEAQTTHGVSAHPMFHRWFAMIERCENPRFHNFAHYGGRGITVCARWHDPAAFVSDMGLPPSPRHSIDRIDNDGGYWCGDASCPDCGPIGRARNLKFSTPSEQALNTRRNRWLVVNGERLRLVEVLKTHGVSRQTFASRIGNGWDALRAATTPPDPRYVENGRRNRLAVLARRSEAA